MTCVNNINNVLLEPTYESKFVYSQCNSRVGENTANKKREKANLVYYIMYINPLWSKNYE